MKKIAAFALFVVLTAGCQRAADLSKPLRPQAAPAGDKAVPKGASAGLEQRPAHAMIAVDYFDFIRGRGGAPATNSAASSSRVTMGATQLQVELAMARAQ